MKTQSKLIVYENSNIEAIIQNETLWLNQEQIAQLFSVQRPAITKHLNNIFKDGELFGKEKADEFEGILQNISNFGGEDLLVGTAQKAANLHS